jgi:hypothetical protein
VMYSEIRPAATALTPFAGSHLGVTVIDAAGERAHASLAQSTDRIGWSELELAVFCATASTAQGTVSLPADGVVRSVRLERDGDGFGVRDDPLEGTVRWKIRVLG